MEMFAHDAAVKRDRRRQPVLTERQHAIFILSTVVSLNE